MLKHYREVRFKSALQNICPIVPRDYHCVLQSEGRIIYEKLEQLKRLIDTKFDKLEKAVTRIENEVSDTKIFAMKAARLLDSQFDSKREEFKFPITNEEQLEKLETQLDDTNMKRKLVSVFV